MGDTTAFGLAAVIAAVFLADALWLHLGLPLLAMALLDRAVAALTIWR